MLIILMILSLSGLSLSLSLPQEMADFAAPFHRACQKLAQQTSEPENYRAIVCGSSLTSSDFRDDLRQTGLVHLMVVSGSHVAFLELLLATLARRHRLFKFLMLPALVLFVLINQLDAAVMRALFSLGLRRLNERLQLAWAQVQILLMSGLLALGFLRDRRELLSLSLSWLLGLALLRMNTVHLESSLYRSLWKNTFAYLLIAPGLLPFSLPHPASILCNIVFAPIMGLILFPVSLLALLVPPLAPLTDHLWRGVSLLVSHITTVIPQGLEPCSIPLFIIFIYVAALTLSAWKREIQNQC